METMEKMGFRLDEISGPVETWRKGCIEVSGNARKTRGWKAWKITEPLRAHGDMLFSGKVRSFATAEAAAAAALKAWPDAP